MINITKTHLLTLAFKTLKGATIPQNFGVDEKDVEYLLKCIEMSISNNGIYNINIQYKDSSWEEYYEFFSRTEDPYDTKRYGVRKVSSQPNKYSKYSSSRWSSVRSMLPRERDDIEEKDQEEEKYERNQKIKNMTPDEQLENFKSSMSDCIARYDGSERNPKGIVENILFDASEMFLDYFVGMYYLEGEQTHHAREKRRPNSFD